MFSQGLLKAATLGTGAHGDWGAKARHVFW